MSALPVTAIEEVKIVRGSSALTMGPMTGSASPGGAPVDGFVIIRTRKPMEDGGQARVAGESYDGVKADLWYGKTLGADQNKGYVAGLVSHSRSQGPNDKLNNNATYNRARETTDGLLKSGYSGHGLLVDFMFYKDEGSFQIPNANSHGSGQGNWFMDPSQTEIYAMSGSQTWDDIHTTLFNVSHSTSNQRFWTSATPVQNDNEVTHVNLRHNMDIDKTRVMVGGDYFYWNAPNGQQYYEGIPREEMTAGWFAQIEQKLFDDKLTLDGSYRGDQVDVIRGLDYYTGGAQPPGGVDTTLKTRNKTLPVATFFSVGAGYEFIKGWKLTGRYGEASVASSGLNAVPGTVLKDDEQFKYEVGIQGEWLPLINPSLNYFHRESANEKTLYGYTFIANNNSTRSCAPGVLPSTGPNAPKLNATLDPCYTQTNTVRDGIEFTLSGNLGLNTSYRASITSFTHLVNAASITPSEIIDFSFRHRLSILSRQFTLSGAFKYLPAYQGALTDATAYLGDYTRYDFGIGYDFNLGKLPITTTLYGQNLTDERYETSNGVPDIGRILGVELMTNF
jgi:outer membrane cobalamin receptor